MLLSGATTQSARAEWVLDHVEAPGTGNITYTAGSAPGIAPVNVSESLSDHNMWGQAGSVAAPTGWSPQRVQATNEVDGKVRAVFKWQSFEDPEMPGGGQAPPEYVTFKIDAFCFAEASRDVNENTLPHDATGEVAEAKIMDVAGSPYPQTHSTRENASTTQYKTVAVNENGYAISPWVEIKATAKIGSNRYTTISMFEGETMEVPLTGTVGIGWQIIFSDPYEKYVLLGRSGAPTPKKEDDPTLDKNKDEWIDGNGTRHGHTRWSYTERTEDLVGVNPQYQNDPVVVSQVISANLVGTWAPYANLIGTWSPTHPMDLAPPVPLTPGNSHSHIQDIPDGGALLNSVGLDQEYNHMTEVYDTVSVPKGWYNTPSQGSSNPIVVTYTLKDNIDGQTSTAAYVLHSHDEWENPRVGNDSAKPNRVYNTEYPVKVNGAVKWYHDNVSRKISGTVTHNWKVGASGSLKAKDLSNLFPEVGVGVNGEIGGSQSFSVDETISKNIAAGKHCYFYVNIHEEQKHYLVDHFGYSGFLGSEDVWLRDSAADGYESGFSGEYNITDFLSRDHIGPNDTVDQNGSYEDLAVPEQ